MCNELKILKEIERDKRNQYNSLKNHLTIVLGFAPYKIREPFIQQQLKDFKSLGKELGELMLLINIKERKNTQKEKNR